MKYAVIDIGSNSVRLMVWSNGKSLYKRINTTRLGEGLASTGRLSEEAIARSALAVKEFLEVAKQEGASSVWAFATAAVRSASNGAEFCQAVFHLCGMEVDVISGEQEAAIGLSGALGLHDGGILDIGGGSSELTLRKGGKVTYAKSLNIGAVRLFDLCARDQEKLKAQIDRQIVEYGNVKVDVPLYGIGGTITSVAALAQGLTAYDPLKIQDYVLTIDAVRTLRKKLFATPYEDILKYSCLPPKRAEIIVGGTYLLEKIMQHVGAGSLIASEKDNLEGYLALRLGEKYYE